MTPSEIKQLTPDGYGGDFEMTTGGKPMTNYNERLDEIIDIFHNKMLALETITDPRDEPSDEIDRTFDDAKQAITSLFKELVAGAKPINKQGDIDIDEPAYNDGYYSGAYNTLEKFEQNLLKALETLE